MIDADTTAFLEKYIADHSITKHTKWNGDRTSALEVAALHNNPGGCTTQDLIQQIKAIIQESTGGK
jgi:hypothetical protein